MTRKAPFKVILIFQMINLNLKFKFFDFRKFAAKFFAIAQIKLIKFKVGLKFSINQLTKLTFRFPSPPNSSSFFLEAHSLSWRAEVTDTCELIINRL